MDKKTLRRIVENLKREGLVKTRQFKVTIYQDKVVNSSSKHNQHYGGGSNNFTNQALAAAS